MIPRKLFEEDHNFFRDTVKKFAENEIVPHLEEWDEAGGVDRKLWNTLGEMGFLCTNIDEAYNGAGCDRLFSMILLEELAPYGGLGISIAMHSDIVAPYIQRYGSEELKQKYLPKMVSGELIGALAMTEPGAGSDVKAIRTTAVKDGEHYIINGSKIFISNGYESGVVVVVAKTDPSAGAKGVSLFVIDESMAGFEKGNKLKKIGMKAQDTAELFFNDMRVPVENLLGEENKGFFYLMDELPWERLQIAISAVACAQDAYDRTVAYTKERLVFGKTVASFQNSKFKLAEMKSEIQIAQVFVDRCMELVLERKLDAETVSMAKYWCSDLQCKVVDECVQLHGGYGYMQEYPVARAWVDARAQRIYGGTNEIMKELISRGI
ncbi:MAG: acyl-CoA dehydrogenase [Alteromonadaceae bacterium]|uniref:acyl-CoA dehydrogenase family protein n=1 Tax=Paraglaciecola chathamensis TaxID=368405 RepID=UPI000C523689|nr:acyl-CoA dehydrogenase family protein [Paraglaciecola agarilytica]MBN24211.1 acyl-CoA dehydrogenase [Alteromonadaceae bacterium]|tara:strand:+ start:1604 stop:2740 length:1137 start_codon:yes stop_codon:yes gene_type:complete